MNVLQGNTQHIYLIKYTDSVSTRDVLEMFRQAMDKMEVLFCSKQFLLKNTDGD